MTTRVIIDVSAIGVGRIVVDGKDLSMLVRGFDLRARVGELTQLTLYAHNLEGPTAAVAVVVHEVQEDQTDGGRFDPQSGQGV